MSGGSMFLVGNSKKRELWVGLRLFPSVAEIRSYQALRVNDVQPHLQPVGVNRPKTPILATFSASTRFWFRLIAPDQALR